MKTLDKLRKIEQLLPTIIDISEIVGVPEKNLFAILENQGIGGSHKDRPAARMLRKVVESGDLVDGSRVVTYTTGSFGPSLAAICENVFENVRPIIVMPENTTEEREEFVRSHNADLVLTPADRVLTLDDKAKGVSVWIRAAVQAATQIVMDDPAAFLMNQSVDDQNNRAFHHLAIQLAHYKPDYVVSACGTGATVVGLGEMLKKVSPRTKIIATEPYKSASAWSLKNSKEYIHHPHVLLGTGPGSHPPILTNGIQFIDGVFLVDDEETYEGCKELLHKFAIKGLQELAPGLTSIANIMAARAILAKEPHAKVFVIFHDQALRYGSRF